MFKGQAVQMSTFSWFIGRTKVLSTKPLMSLIMGMGKLTNRRGRITPLTTFFPSLTSACLYYCM